MSMSETATEASPLQPDSTTPIHPAPVDPAPVQQDNPIASSASDEIALEAYWKARKAYLARIRHIPELRKRFYRELTIYLLRRLLWSFGFFPIFIAFWVPLVLSSFNPVAMVAQILPALQNYVNSNPELQANTHATLLIGWLSIGFFFAVFDFVLTPFKSPYAYEADLHMRIWEKKQLQGTSKPAGQATEPKM